MSDLVEQIKADREAGTPGPWDGRMVPHGMPINVCNYGVISVKTGMEAARVWAIDDARRIARVPDLEDAYLAAHARIEAQAALIAEMTEALRPFCFFDADHPKTDTTQRAWDIRYTDRFQDWIGFDDIEAARDALARAEEAQK